jgi:transketolase
MLGDGEAQEGQVWEAAFIATQYRLGNLTCILDWNGLQQFGWGVGSSLERRPPAEHVPAAFRAFGWDVVEIDGHDMAAIVGAYRQALLPHDRPLLIAARTVKGKGVSFMEHDFNWHARVPNAQDVERALHELQESVG